MECSWRRTVASVLILLSPHCFLCQNVMPTGTVLPLQKEPLREDVDMNSGLTPQQMNFFSPTKEFLPEYLPQSQYLTEYQQIPDYLEPIYRKPLSSVPQANIGPFTQDTYAAFDIPQTNMLPQIQSPLGNALSKTKIAAPQAPPLNIKSSLMVENNPFITSPIANLSPIEEVSSKPGTIAQSSNFISPVMNLQVLQGSQPKISAIHKVPNLNNQFVACPQRPLVPIAESALNVPAVIPNQNTLKLPLVSNPYSQSFVKPISSSSRLTTDLTSLNYISTPNLPISEPIENCAPISEFPVQSLLFPESMVPVDYVSNTPVSSNCQISVLPPVFPANLAQLNNNFCSNPAPATDEYTPVPINLQINVPSPTIPEPKITIITAYPPAAPAPETPDITDVSFGSYPPYPLPPIIIEGRRSKTKSWLPLILIALIANDGSCGGGCCCCCPCSSQNSDIPIPYPIPIPTNNPIIMGNSKKSRKTVSKVQSSSKKNN